MKLSEYVRSTNSADGAVVLDILHNQIFRLNIVGSRMLELLKDGRTKNQIVDQIVDEFSADPELVARDIQEFLSHLEKHRLIEPDVNGRLF